MELLLFALVIVLVAVLVIWAIDQVPMPTPLGGVVKAIVILIAAVVILRNTGVV